MKQTYHLFIPQLLKPLNVWQHDFLFEAEAPNLSLLLSDFGLQKNHSNTLSIYTAFFSTLEKKELPIAAYRQQLHLKEKHQYIACADPVTFEVSMNDVTLTNKITDLSDDEAHEILDTLNQHFTNDGLRFVFGSNQHWYVVSDQDEQIKSHDIDAVLRQNIIEKSSTSTKRNWQVIQNEIQMLLHSSEINQQREIAGHKPVNSLWVWGGGQEVSPRFKAKRLISSDESSSAIKGQIFARAEVCDWEPLAEKGDALFIETDSSKPDTILLLDQLFEPAIKDQIDNYQQQLSKIDRNYLAPLLNAWKSGEIDIVIDCCDGQIIKPNPVPAWKFWSKPTVLKDIK